MRTRTTMESDLRVLVGLYADGLPGDSRPRGWLRAQVLTDRLNATRAAQQAGTLFRPSTVRYWLERFVSERYTPPEQLRLPAEEVASTVRHPLPARPIHEMLLELYSRTGASSRLEAALLARKLFPHVHTRAAESANIRVCLHQVRTLTVPPPPGCSMP